MINNCGGMGFLGYDATSVNVMQSLNRLLSSDLQITISQMCNNIFICNALYDLTIYKIKVPDIGQTSEQQLDV